jgi:cell division protein FtsQ
MGRRQTAQLGLNMVDDSPMEPPQPMPVRRSRSQPEPRPRWRARARRWVLVLFLVALVFGVIAGLYRLDQFLASDARFVLPGAVKDHPNLVIHGVTHTSEQRVASVFASDFGRSIYLLPLGERRRALLAIDWVRDAVVSRRWPNRVDVSIVERVPVAFAMLPVPPRVPGGLVSYEMMLVDADGVLLNPPMHARFALPALYGINPQQPIAVRRNRVQLMLQLMHEVDAYSGQISEIDASDPENLTITYSLNGRVLRLMLGHANYLARLSNFLARYDEIGRRVPTARLFDLRLDNRITARDEAPDVK